jgi:hypothetical protein
MLAGGCSLTLTLAGAGIDEPFKSDQSARYKRVFGSNYTSCFIQAANPVIPTANAVIPPVDTPNPAIPTVYHRCLFQLFLPVVSVANPLFQLCIPANSPVIPAVIPADSPVIRIQLLSSDS